MGMASELARAQPLSAPRICCLDLDTFFVSVERLLDPTLEGKPVVVGGKPGSRGVVTAASYEVRRLGVKSGMSLTEAGKRAPNAIYLPTRHEIYGTYAERVREVARRFAPKVLVASIDEMYLDLSGCERLYGVEGAAGAKADGGEDRAGDAATEAAVLKLTAAIWDELGLPASAGIATSKVVATDYVMEGAAQFTLVVDRQLRTDTASRPKHEGHPPAPPKVDESKPAPVPAPEPEPEPARIP
jgi:DNA polymerase-4